MTRSLTLNLMKLTPLKKVPISGKKEHGLVGVRRPSASAPTSSSHKKISPSVTRLLTLTPLNMSPLKRCSFPVHQILPLLPNLLLQQPHKRDIGAYLMNPGRKEGRQNYHIYTGENVCRVTLSQQEIAKNYSNRIRAFKNFLSM